MPRFSSKRRVHHTASQMFDLVADVERYPEFVPLCQSLRIRQRTPGADGIEIIVADMTVSFKLVRETFTSRVTLDRPNLKILVEYLKGPFSNLENRWTFEPKSEADCDVGFFLSYEFRSRMLAMLMGTMLTPHSSVLPPRSKSGPTRFTGRAGRYRARLARCELSGGCPPDPKRKGARHRRSRRDRPAAARHCHNACALFPALRPGRRA